MAIVARTFCILMLALGFYLIGKAVFSVDAEVVWRLVFGFLMAGAGYQLWARVDRVEAHKRAARARR
jgi:uncharacterized membrane protein YedE/YeeE